MTDSRLLASAISGRPLEVAAGDPGMPAWSDGRTVFIDAAEAHRTQLQCVVVQASLLCVGSLEPRVLDQLARKPTATRRYLSLEGHARWPPSGVCSRPPCFPLRTHWRHREQTLHSRQCCSPSGQRTFRTPRTSSA